MIHLHLRSVWAIMPAAHRRFAVASDVVMGALLALCVVRLAAIFPAA